ncbi:MFS transporter [Actinacidiphila yeochonensis]|uniref:MFS transporter n=1 Tax=Actinacidiphila yeochonensis TaxID=89050 RepID=UPI001E633267|nr:MFS transporter [Actinacidiphila yeochonensis]
MSGLGTTTSALPAGHPAVTYRDVLRVRYLLRLQVGTLTGRLPNGMAPLAILLSTAHPYGYATASGLASLYLIASAIGGPQLGRLVDRRGQTLPFTLGAAVSSAALVTIVAGPQQQAFTAVAVLLAGAAKPPLESGLRSLISTGHLMPSRSHERVALALDAALQELIYIAGPLLVAVIAWSTSAAAAMGATAAAGAAGTLLVVTTPPSHAWRPAAVRPAAWLGPLKSRPLQVLYLSMVCYGIPIGALTPLALAAATEHHLPALSGALPAALSVGAVLGGLLYGARSWPGTTADHLLVLAAASTAGWSAYALANSPVALLFTTLIPGLVMAPLLAAAFAATSALAPRALITEAHALLVAALDLGCAAGTASAAVLHEVLLPAAAAAAALTLAAARHHPALTAPPKESHS